MQTLNSQRKAFLDMVAWSEGTDNGRQKTRNHGYDVIVGGELFTDYSDHPRKLVTLNPKLKSTAAGRYQLLSRWWDAYRKQLGLKDFSPESQDAVALQQIKERGALQTVDEDGIGSDSEVKKQFAGVVTVDRSLENRRMQAGQVISGAILIVTTERLTQGQTGRDADIVTYQGRDYRVTFVDPYTAYGAGFVQAHCELMPFDGGTPVEQ